jgi:hypothetical protein
MDLGALIAQLLLDASNWTAGINTALAGLDVLTSAAQAAGAADLRVTATRDIREAQVEGNPMFIEATVTVTASGRPRVAHETRPESLTISP